MTDKPLTIVSLEAQNVKRLKAVTITPKGNVVEISGKNGQGKSSVLDSIMYALGGKDTFCEDPVRKGEQKATIKCDLGELAVTRTITVEGGGTLTVKDKNGATLAAVASMAQQNGGQVWVETVGQGSDISVVIEDGHVKADGAPEQTHATAPASEALTPGKQKELLEGGKRRGRKPIDALSS